MSSSLEVNVLFLSETGPVNLDRSIEYENKIKGIVQKKFALVSRGIQLRAALCQTLSFKLNDEAVYSLAGNLSLGRLEDSTIQRCLTRLCTLPEFAGLWVNFDKEKLERELVFGANEKPSHKINAHRFAFGVIVNFSHFLHHFKSDDEGVGIAHDDIQVEFRHDHQVMTLLFRVREGDHKKRHSLYKVKRYKLVLSYSNMRDILVSLTQDTLTAFLMLRCPPLLFRLVSDTIDHTSQRRVHTDDVSALDGWVRVENLEGLPSDVLGKSNVLSISFNRILHKEKLPAERTVHCPFSILNSIQHFNNTNVWFTYVEQKKSEKPGPITIVLPNGLDTFSIQYAVTCIESLSFQLNDHLRFNKQGTQFRKLIAQFAELDYDCLEDSLTELFYEFERCPFVRPLSAIKTSFKRKRENKSIENVQHNMVMIRRAVITPSKIMFLPKYPFLRCRFTNISNSEYALRVLLRDDNFEYLGYSLNQSDHTYLKGFEMKYSKQARETGCCVYRLIEEDLKNNRGFQAKKDDCFKRRVMNILQAKRLQKEFLEKCIKVRLLNGLRIGDRTYQYIGSSTSQLREYGLFLYAKDERHRDAACIRSLFGTITEKNVAKYVARLGLALSQALAYLDIPSLKVVVIPDLKTEDGKYTFSDGVGKVSLSTAEKLFVVLKQHGVISKDEKNMPSAFQIRLGGCKGMIVVDPKLKGDEICIRPSMEKFVSGDMTNIGILKASGVRATYLNRPFITLLEQLGTNQTEIFKLLAKRIKDVYKAYISEKKAAELLFQFSARCMKVKFTDLTRAGIDLLNEAFFRHVLENCISQSLKALREQARIQIPLELGRTVYGVVDETGTLTYGQVFIQPTHHNDNDQTKPLVAKVMVTKFPCMHPGDVRLFDAVDVPSLHHIKDCIVFPAKGPRPHPDEMAGSDLDGDEYAVIWDKNLFIKENHEPMDYSAAKALEFDEIRETDIFDFYVRYVKDYSVGRIASAHLAWADRKSIFQPVCQGLAKKYAISLDFAKTGCNETLESEERVQEYPDFMQKFAEKSYYLSERTLGSLYRTICVAEHGLNTDVPSEFKYDANPLLTHKDFTNFMGDAEAAYQKYKLMAQRLQQTFHVRTEADLISCTVPSAFVENTEGSFNSQRMLRILVRKMFATLREDFERNCPEEVRLVKASAYYIFTYATAKKSEQPYYGLPWTVADYLAKLAQLNQQDGDEISSEDQYISLINKRCLNTTGNRFEQALAILMHWLENQESFHLGLHHSRQLLETELRTSVNDLIVSSIPTGELSVGDLVLKVLKKYAKKLFYHEPFVNPGVAQLSIVAMRTLQACFKTNSIKFVMQEEICCNESMGFKRFHITFGRNDGALRYHIASEENSFMQMLKGISNCKELYADWYEAPNGWWYFYITAYGSQTSLAMLTKQIAKVIKDFQVCRRQQQQQQRSRHSNSRR